MVPNKNGWIKNQTYANSFAGLCSPHILKQTYPNDRQAMYLALTNVESYEATINPIPHITQYAHFK
jgi:hypothetical protein